MCKSFPNLVQNIFGQKSHSIDGFEWCRLWSSRSWCLLNARTHSEHGYLNMLACMLRSWPCFPRAVSNWFLQISHRCFLSEHICLCCSNSERLPKTFRQMVQLYGYREWYSIFLISTFCVYSFEMNEVDWWAAILWTVAAATAAAGVGIPTESALLRPSFRLAALDDGIGGGGGGCVGSGGRTWISTKKNHLKYDSFF